MGRGHKDHKRTQFGYFSCAEVFFKSLEIGIANGLQVICEFCCQIHGSRCSIILMRRIRSTADGHSKPAPKTPRQCPPDLLQQVFFKRILFKNRIHDVSECVQNFRIVTDDPLIRRFADICKRKTGHGKLLSRMSLGSALRVSF